jgi:hypothetical protein
VSRDGPGPGSGRFSGGAGGGVRASAAGGDGRAELRFALIAARPVRDP